MDSFDERDPAVKRMLSLAIQACRRQGKYVGICGQGPSDYPDLAEWLMAEGIESMSLNPDTVVETWLHLAKVADRVAAVQARSSYVRHTTSQLAAMSTRQIASLAATGLAVVEQIEQNTKPIWQLNATNHVAVQLLGGAQAIEGNAMAIAGALSAGEQRRAA